MRRPERKERQRNGLRGRRKYILWIAIDLASSKLEFLALSLSVSRPGEELMLEDQQNFYSTLWLHNNLCKRLR
jgi:hypothetical protein